MLDLFIIVFLLALVIPKMEVNHDNESLSVISTTSLKGLLSVIIVLNHFTGWFIYHTPVTYLFVHCGAQAVSVFFFLSSYGLYQKYKDIVSLSFIWKRAVKLFVPYWLCEAIYCIASYFFHIPTKADVNIKNILIAFTGYVEKSEIVENAWFVTAIAIMYFMYFLCAKILPKTRMSIKLIILIFIFEIFTKGKWMGGLMAFWLGLLIAENEHLIIKLRTKKIIVFMVTMVIGIILAAIAKFAGDNIGNNAVMNLGDVISSVFIPVFIYLLEIRVKIKNKILGFLGKISYETYLLHGLMIHVAYSICGLDKRVLFCILTFTFTFLSAFIVNKLSKPVFGLLIKKQE